jgi:hypothetical protein
MQCKRVVCSTVVRGPLTKFICGGGAACSTARVLQNQPPSSRPLPIIVFFSVSPPPPPPPTLSRIVAIRDAKIALICLPPPPTRHPWQLRKCALPSKKYAHPSIDGCTGERMNQRERRRGLLPSGSFESSYGIVEYIFPRIYSRTYYAHPRMRVMSFLRQHLIRSNVHDDSWR